MRRSSSICLTGSTTHTDTPTLPLQMRPAAYQAGTQVLQPRQFDLQLALVAACTLGKYLKNQKGPVVDRQPQMALQIALLTGAQALIKQDFLGTGSWVASNLISSALPRANEQSRIGRFALAGDPRNGLHARRLANKPNSSSSPSK
jgi:hypothetical protein